jgi:hypothetical protein
MLMWYIRIGCSFLFGLIIVFKFCLKELIMILKKCFLDTLSSLYSFQIYSNVTVRDQKYHYVNTSHIFNTNLVCN